MKLTSKYKNALNKVGVCPARRKSRKFIVQGSDNDMGERINTSSARDGTGLRNSAQ